MEAVGHQRPAHAQLRGNTWDFLDFGTAAPYARVSKIPTGVFRHLRGGVWYKSHSPLLWSLGSKYRWLTSSWHRTTYTWCDNLHVSQLYFWCRSFFLIIVIIIIILHKANKCHIYVALIRSVYPHHYHHRHQSSTLSPRPSTRLPQTSPLISPLTALRLQAAGFCL